MKYIIIYVIFVFILYVLLKYYCYKDQQNIFNSIDSKSDTLKSNDTNRSELPISNTEPFSISHVNLMYSNDNNNYNDTNNHYKTFHSSRNYNYISKYDDYNDYNDYNDRNDYNDYNNHHYDNNKHSINSKYENNIEYFYDNNDNTKKIHWKSFGTDISSNAVKEKKLEFREIKTPNISIENFNIPIIYNTKTNDINKIPFLINTDTITKQDRNEISLSNLITPKTIETYDNITGKPKVKSFGLVMKKQFKSVNKLSKTFRAIRFKSDIQLPKDFNGPLIWKDYLSPITDQGKCGNCWAHASSSVLADRFAILSLGKIKFVPSPYEMTICSFDFQNVDITKVWKNKEELEKMDRRMHENRSCNGNNLYDTATSLFTEGVTDLSCFPNNFNVNGKIVNIGETDNTSNFPYCYKVTGIELDTCIDGKTPMRKYRCKTAYVCSKENDDITLKERKLMYDIYKYGPVIVGFILFPDFLYGYDGKSIYTHPDKSGGDLGGHAVRLVGWGEETVNGQLIKYWWIANSWGTDWGINGYFRMKRCMPEIELEDNVMSVIPDFPGITIDDPNLEAVESEKDKEIQNYTGHSLDKTTGYYNTSIEKISKCEIRGKMFPYISNSFIQYLPKYKEFFAAKVTEHINSNNINNIPYSNDIPTYYCPQDYTPPPQPPQAAISSSTKKDSSENNYKKDNTTQKSSTNTDANKPSEPLYDSKFQKYICEVVNYKYFDAIYLFISLIFLIFLYYIFYYQNIIISEIKSDDNSNKSYIINAKLQTIQSQTSSQQPSDSLQSSSSPSLSSPSPSPSSPSPSSSSPSSPSPSSS